MDRCESESECYERTDERSSVLLLKKRVHDKWDWVLQEYKRYGPDEVVRQGCSALHKVLPGPLRIYLTPEKILDAVKLAVHESGGGHVCACCSVDKLLLAARYNLDKYACQHRHDHASPDPVYAQAEPARIRRVGVAMASPNPTRYAAARQRDLNSSGSDSDSSRAASPSPSGYASASSASSGYASAASSASSSSSSSVSSDGGRVKTKRAARTSPYSRPSATAAPRSRSVASLAKRVAKVDLDADSDVDGVTGKLRRVDIADPAHGYFGQTYYQPAATSAYCPQPQPAYIAPKQSAVRKSAWPSLTSEY